MPINRKAEISHSFFSIHLQTLCKIFVELVLAKIFPKRGKEKVRFSNTEYRAHTKQ